MDPLPIAPPLDPLGSIVPRARLLSNGRYSAMITARGGGFSRADGMALTRWAGDPVEDASGLHLWLREPGAALCAPLFPAVADPAARLHWRPGALTCARELDGIDVQLDACVAPEALAELRRVTLVNRSDRPRHLELTTCAEVVLHDRTADASHPAFSKLFVQTEYVASHEALVARRRPRGHDERFPVLVHALDGPGALEHETDRVAFVGRGRDFAHPLALAREGPLGGTTGNVLDPVVALRRRLTLPPGARAELVAILGVAGDRAAALELVATLGRRVGDAFDRSAAMEARLIAALRLSDGEAEYLHALAGAMVYGHPGLRRAGGAPEGARLAELGPIAPPRDGVLVVVHADGSGQAGIVPDVLRAHRYWRALGLETRLVVTGDAADARSSGEADEVHVVRPAALDARTRALLDAAADLVIEGAWPDLTTPLQVEERRAEPGAARHAAASAGADREALVAFNGLGGFSPDGREYVLRLEPDPTGATLPPQPWVNVIAHETFGMLVSERGAATTWSGNSREHRLTPWSNDPLLDPHGEALWLRDEEAGRFWSVAPGPTPHPGGYEVRHGFGASAFHGRDGELEFSATLFVADGLPVQVTRVRLANAGPRPRRLSLFAWQRLVLGGDPIADGRHVVTAHDRSSGALFARSPLAGEWSRAVAFAAAVLPAGVRELGVTCDRREFVGSPGRVAAPAALRAGRPLSGAAGAGLDPCFARQLAIELGPGEQLELTLLFGEAGDEHAARALIERLREPGAVEAAHAGTASRWRESLERVRIETPEPALDLMVNGWLAYQNLSCRLWGRTAFYQSGGAYGFRDQLQDAVAMLWLRPDLTREQIVRHAAHQFVEGDVLHWWHPPRSRGIRTRFADDLLWLPWAVAQYVRATGDDSVLDERAPFLTARALEPGEDEVFLEPQPSGEDGDVFEHCVRALDRSLTTGAHGLPLFGTGDWNDGMNRVGRLGQGESVWMAMFLHHVLGEFLPLLARRGDEIRLGRYETFRGHLADAANGAGWDGEWYRRGYYDDGTPLGTKQGDECRIDALAQAWAVISGIASPPRARQALDALERELISERDGLVRLLKPPFEHTRHDPGYIKGYVPGVRENGGQYTHAALWVVRAFAEQGRSERAARLLAMLSPIQHTRTPDAVARYRVEPYVVAADVYGAEPHVGRGGWTWYTGSAGWMLRVAVESVLGLSLVGGARLELRPCLPAAWRRCRVVWRVPGGDTTYEIEYRQRDADAVAAIELRVDGALQPLEDGVPSVPIARDGATHRIELEWSPIAGPSVIARSAPGA